VGSFGYLVKPYSERELYANIEMTLFKARTEREAQQLNEEIRRHKEKLHALTVELLSVEERQRRDIAYELHENILQLLAMCLYHVRTLGAAEDASDRVGAQNELVDMLNQTMKYTRTLTYQLHPPNLRELGLDAAIAWRLEQYQQEHPIVCQFRGDLELEDVPRDIRPFLFQATQELLVNIAKHAQADKVELSTWKTEDALCISIEDNGVGFDADQVTCVTSDFSGFGLFSMRERLDDLGGGLTIDSHMGRGTKVVLTVPHQYTMAKTPDKSTMCLTSDTAQTQNAP